MEETYRITDRGKKISFAFMGLGLLGLILGILLNLDNPDRVWANLLLNNYYFLGISLIGVFFVAIHVVGYGGWYVMTKRVAESMGAFIPIAGVIMLVIIAGAYLHWHGIYHWAHEGAADHDPILAGKMPFFNPLFFIGRTVLYFFLWIVLSRLLRKYSLKEGMENTGINFYKKSKAVAAGFIVVFAVTESTMSWDYIMSIDTHWYSTLFGWYNFASYFVAGLCTLTLFLVYLKSRGYLAMLSGSHLHDLGKFIFAFSIFWTYLWFSQYMLIWYANIPEETVYFKERIADFQFAFYFNLAINFLVPFFVLMKRKSKRNLSTLVTVCFILLFGHWFDFYMMIMPGALGTESGFGLIEVLLPFAFIGGFMYVVLNALSKVPLVPSNNPYFKESLQHHT